MTVQTSQVILTHSESLTIENVITDIYIYYQTLMIDDIIIFSLKKIQCVHFDLYIVKIKFELCWIQFHIFA